MSLINSFCSVFNKRIDNLSSIPGHGCDYLTVLPVHLINDLICTPSEVAKVLKSVNVSKAWGFPAVAQRMPHGTGSIFDEAL